MERCPSYLSSFSCLLGITVLTTGLIFYRVAHVSDRMPGQKSRYLYAIEVLVESGVRFSATLLIAGVLLVTCGNDITNYPLVQPASYWGGILTPVTININFSRCGVLH